MSVKSQKDSDDYSGSIVNGAGKKIGNIFLEKCDDGVYDLNWINIKKKERGKGYAQQTLKQGIDFVKSKDAKRITLEVPKGDDDARHIYEKLGFKDDVTRQVDDSILDYMYLDLRKK